MTIARFSMVNGVGGENLFGLQFSFVEGIPNACRKRRPPGVSYGRPKYKFGWAVVVLAVCHFGMVQFSRLCRTGFPACYPELVPGTDRLESLSYKLLPGFEPCRNL